MTCARFIVTGNVQGVFFRAATHERAMRLGITGHAKNLADGSVEVVASGSLEAVDELDAWLHHGPPSAQVERVRREALPEQSWSRFTTG